MKVKPRGESAAPTAKKCRRSKRSTSYRAEDDVKVHTGPSAEAALLSVVPAGRVVALAIERKRPQAKRTPALVKVAAPQPSKGWPRGATSAVWWLRVTLDPPVEHGGVQHAHGWACQQPGGSTAPFVLRPVKPGPDKRRKLREELGPLLDELSLKYGGTPADFHDHIMPAILAHGAPKAPLASPLDNRFCMAAQGA